MGNDLTDRSDVVARKHKRVINFILQGLDLLVNLQSASFASIAYRNIGYRTTVMVTERQVGYGWYSTTTGSSSTLHLSSPFIVVVVAG